MTFLLRPALLLVALVTILLRQEVSGKSSSARPAPRTYRPVSYVPAYYYYYPPVGSTSRGHDRGYSPVNNPPHFPGESLPPLPPPLVWDARLPFENGPINVTDFLSGLPRFTIQNRKNDLHHSFEVVNSTGDALVKVHLVRSARWGHRFTYNTHWGARYTIHPRGAKTDRWYMQMEGNDPDVNYQNLIYFRGHKDNIGNIYFRNYSRVASFTFDEPKNKTYLGGAKNTVKLEILSPTNIGLEYFIGLWATVKLRMDQHGP